MSALQTKSSKLLSLMTNVAKAKKSFSYPFYSRFSIVQDHPLLEDPSKQLLMKINVDKRFSNQHGTLHGGAASTIADTATTVALSGFDTKNRTNSSVNLTLSYLAPALLGSDVYVLNDVVKVGRNLGFTECRIYDEDMRLLVTGRHTKIFLDHNYNLEEGTW